MEKDFGDVIEFGSDFNFIEPGNHTSKTIRSFYPSACYYADGRLALIHLYKTQGWKRLWIPDYFCYTVVKSLKLAGLNLQFYHDLPSNEDDTKTLETIQRNGCFHSSDAVLRVNYFGTRSYRTNKCLSNVTVVEDHTHDLIGDWAKNSTAEWCIASLRKTLPIPEGGILWSPMGLRLPETPFLSEKNESIAAVRWEAMRLKTRFLSGENIDKSLFRSCFVETEAFFEIAPVCSLDCQSKEYLNHFDIQEWYSRKLSNWSILRDIKKDGVHILEPDCLDCYPFSIVLLFDTLSERNRVRNALIEHRIYPAILWDVPSTADSDIINVSCSMLSIHCDARYSTEDILQLKLILESLL